MITLHGASRRIAGLRSRARFAAAAAILGALLTTMPGMAQSDVAEDAPAALALPTAEDPIKEGLISPDAVAAIARELNCPLCQGYNLQDCPLTVCAQMRMLIAQELAAGKSAEEIRAGFVADYGPQVLNAPPTRGGWLAAWLAPGVALLLAAAWMGRRWTKRDADATRASTDAKPARPVVPPGSDDVAAADGAAKGAFDASDEDYASRFEALAREDRA